MRHHFDLSAVLDGLQRWRSKIWNPTYVWSAIIIALIWTSAVLFCWNEQHQNEADLSSQAINLALNVEQRTAQTIQNLDTFLIFVRDHHGANSFNLPEIAQSNNKIKNNQAYLFITNAKGDVISASSHVLPLRRVNIAKRATFIAQAEGHDDKLIISKPIVGRLSRKWVIQLSRPLRKPDGSFDGIVGIGLPVSTITSMYNDASLGVGGGVALLGQDGIFRAGTMAFGSLVGKRYQQPPVVGTIPVNLIFNGGEGGKVEKQIFDGVPRIVASVPFAAFPLQVLVAMTSNSVNNVVAGYYQAYFALAAICTLIVLFATMGIQRAETRALKSINERKEMEIQKKVAEASAIDKSMFLAVMSHEIRTPLNGVLGALDLIRGPDLDDRRMRCVSTATECGETLLSLIDDILLLSKSEHSKIDLIEEPFCLKEFCFGVHEFLYSLSLTNQNRLELSVCAEASQEVVGDAHRLRQVLTNLIGNANKFTKRGRITLGVETLAKSAESLVVRISVSDTGIGIPKEQQSLIFDQFRTLDASYSRRTDGTGLGLAICDKLIRAMGSEIKLESEVGQGSRFFFDLTFGCAAQKAIAAPIPTPRELDPSAGPSLRILLAEDNLTNTYVATEMLEDCGHTVRHAANGRLAVELAQAEKFDVILMDISMPEMDGIQATELIRSSGSINAATPIIALTAHAIAGDNIKFMSGKMSGYLKKPIRKGDLLSAIVRFTAAVTSPSEPEIESAEKDPIIDIAVLAEFVRDRTIDRSAKILSIFVLELEQKEPTLCQAISAYDCNSLQMLTHSMLGSGSMAGAGRLVQLSRSIESRCMGNEMGDWAEAEELLVTLRKTVDEFKALETREVLETWYVRNSIAA